MSKSRKKEKKESCDKRRKKFECRTCLWSPIWHFLKWTVCVFFFFNEFVFTILTIYYLVLILILILAFIMIKKCAYRCTQVENVMCILFLVYSVLLCSERQWWENIHPMHLWCIVFRITLKFFEIQFLLVQSPKTTCFYLHVHCFSKTMTLDTHARNYFFLMNNKQQQQQQKSSICLCIAFWNAKKNSLQIFHENFWEIFF